MGTFSDTFLLAMHTIKGLLYPNHLENATGKYILHAQHDPKVLTLEDIATSAIQRGGVSLTRDVLIEAYRAMAAEAVHQAADGFIVNTDVIRLAVELGGVYNGIHDPVKPAELRFSITPSAKMRTILKNIDVKIDGLAHVDGYISQVLNVVDGMINSTITPGDDIVITGDRLKIAGSDADCGVYFIADYDDTRTKITHPLIENTPAKVIIRVPELSPGQYKLELMSQYSSSGKDLKTPRTISSQTNLTVN